MKSNIKKYLLFSIIIINMMASNKRLFADDGGFVLRNIEKQKNIKTKKIKNNYSHVLTPKKMKSLYQSSLYKSFYDVLKIKGFDEYYIPRLFCIAKLESNLNPTATNINKNKTFDVGLFQINSVWENVCHKKEYLYETEKNIDCARIIVSRNGLSPWVTYRKFGYICEESLKI